MDYKVVNPIPQKDINEILSYYYINFDGLKKIGSGYSATVFKYKNYAIKAYEDECFNDGEILESFQDNDLFPKLYFYNEYFMVTEYLEITDAYNYFERNVDINISAVDVFEYCYKKGYVPMDIHDDNVIVTNDDKLKILDVGAFKKIYPAYNINNVEKMQIHAIDFAELDNIINHVKRPPIVI